MNESSNWLAFHWKYACACASGSNDGNREKGECHGSVIDTMTKVLYRLKYVILFFVHTLPLSFAHFLYKPFSIDWSTLHNWRKLNYFINLQENHGIRLKLKFNRICYSLMSHFYCVYEIDFVSEKSEFVFRVTWYTVSNREKKKQFKIRESVVVDEMTNLPYVLI